MDSHGSDLKIEMEEKEKMLEQLKLMVREKDEILRKKDSEMQDAKANLSKFKLQSKAKITKLTHQLEEAKKASISDNASDKSSECGDDTPTEQANRAKMKLFRRKLEDKDRQLKEKDDQINNRDQQMIAKEKIIEERNQVIQQREEMIRTITDQLHERDKIIKYFGQSENQPSGEQIDQIYAQILYKDKLIVDLNNKILELDRKIIDLQEFAGEKDEVVKGRDKVISVLQMSMVEKDQNVTSQSALIKKLTGKVETYEENLSLLKEKLENAEHSLKVESERFNLRLNETQKYFEETLGERESEISQLRVIIREREKDVATRDNDLRELLLRHEQDLQEIMSRGEGSMQDHVVKMLEQKLKDINGVLDSKVQVIEMLTSDVASKDQQLLDIGNTMKSLKEKLAVSTEQNLLQQQTFADLEMQWKEEKSKLEARLRASGEKLEEEKGELNLQLHTLQTSLKQYEAAYSQAAVQYNALQERYQQAYLEVQELRAASSSVGSPPPQQQHVDPSLTSTIDTSELLKQLESETTLRKKVEEKLNSQQEEISRLQNLQMSGSFSETSASGEKTDSNSKQRQSSPGKSVASSKSGNKSGDKQKSASDTQGSKTSEAKLLKIKAQYTAKIKTLEKEVQELKKSGGGGGCSVSPDVETLQNRLAEVEEEKGNLMLHLVDFDDTRALQGQLEQQLSETQKQNQTLQDEMQQLQQQLQEAQFETSHLSERISQMQEIEQQIRMEFANEKAAILASEEAQKMQLTTQLNQLQEECNRLGNQIQEDMKERDCLYQQFQHAEQNINELQAQVQASNAAVEELQKNLIERSEQTSKLAGEKIGLEVRAAELEEIRDQLEQEKSDLLTKIESLQNRIEFDKEPAIAFEKESQNLQEKIQELTLQISKEKGISKAQKEEINKLLPKLDQMETEKFQLEEEKKEMKEHLITLTQEKEETDTLLRETKSVLESLQRGEESVNGILQEKEKENMDLKTQLADMRKTLQHQNHEIVCICKSLELKNISVEHLSNAVQNRISSISDLQGKLEKAEKELEKALEIGMKRETKLESLKSQLKNHKEMETSVQKMTEECDSYKDDLLTKDQTIQLLQETVESQNNEMQKFHELQKTRDEILSSLELKVEEYESNNLEMNKEHNVKTQTLETRIESLQKELDVKIQEVAEMKSKVAVLSKELESKAEELHKLKIKSNTKSNETDRRLTEMDNETKGLKVELQEKTEAIKKYEEHSREISVTISQLQDDNFAKNCKIESLSKSLSEFSEKCNELSRLHVSANNEREYLTQQIQEYQILEESARGLLTKEQLEVMTPHEKGEQERPVLRMHNYLSHISTQLQELRAVKMQAETSLLESNKQNGTLKQKLQESETLCSEKDSQLLNMKSDSSEHKVMLQGLVEERDQKISSLQQELNSINILLEEKQAQLNTLRANLLTKDSELSNITSHLEMAKQHEAGLKDELNSLREDVLSKETANATLQASVAEQHEKVSHLSENFQIALHEKDAVHVEIVNLRNDLMLLTNTNLELKKGLADTEQLLAERERTFSELSSHLQIEKNNSTVELQSRDTKITELEKCCAESAAEVADLTSKVEFLERRIADEEEKSKTSLQEKEESELEIKKLLQEFTEKHNEKQRLDKEFGLLTEEMNKAQEQLIIVSQTVSDRDNAIEELQKTNTRISEELKKSLTDLETAMKEKNQRKEKEVESQRNLSAMGTEILKLKTECEDLKTSKTDAKEELTKEIELLRLEKHECDLDLNNFKVTLQEKEDFIQNLMLALDESKGVKEKMDKERMAVLQEKESFLETIMAENKEFAVKIEALSDEKKLMKKQLDGLKETDSEKQSLASKLEKAASEKETLKTKLKEAIAKIQSLGSKLKNAVSEKNDLAAKLKSNVAEKEILNEQLKESVSERDILNAKLEKNIVESKNLNAMLKAVSSEKDSLSSMLQEMESEREGHLERLKEQNSNEESLNNKTEFENERLQSLLTGMESDVIKLRKENSELLEELSAAKLELQSINEERTQQLGGLKIQLNAALEENDALQAENKGLHSSLEQRLYEKDIIADELAQVDMKLVAAIQDKTKTRNHLDQLMRDHNKCADMEPRLEKALRDKRLLAEELSQVDGKLVQLLNDKENLSVELAEVEHRLEETIFEKQEVLLVNEQLTKDLNERKAVNEQMEKLGNEENTNMAALMEELRIQKETIEKLNTELESNVSEKNIENKGADETRCDENLIVMLEREKSEALSKAGELEEKLSEAEAEISRLTKLYSEQACESERLFQSKVGEMESLNEHLARQTEELSAAQTKINELKCCVQSRETEMSSIANEHAKAFEDLAEFLMKKLNHLLLIDLDGSNLSCVNVVDPNEPASEGDTEKGHRESSDFIITRLDVLKNQMSEKLSKIEHWQSKVVENSKNDRSSLEKNLQELEESQKQQESQSKLVKKLAQNLKRIKGELSEKGKALEQVERQQAELELALIKERSRIKETKDDLRNFVLSSFSADAKIPQESNDGGTKEIELASVIEDLKSKFTVAIKESDDRISELQSLLQTEKEQVSCLEQTVSTANCTANSQVELSKELQERYSECCKQLEEMQAKMTELDVEFSASKKENLQLMQVSKKLKDSRAQKMAEVDSLKQQLTDEKLENQNLSEKFQSMIMQLEETSARISAEEELSKMKVKCGEENLELVSVKKLCETLENNHEKTVEKLNNEIATLLSEMREVKENFQHLEKELSERNFEISTLQQSIKEADARAAKLTMQTEAKELKISSLNEATQIMKSELDKCYEEMQKKCSDSTIVMKENSEAIQKLTDLNSSIFSSLNELQHEIQRELMTSRTRKKPSIAEDLQDIIEKSDNLEHSVITSVCSPSDSIAKDLCLLEESRPESSLEFLKWLRGYLSDLWSSQKEEFTNAQNVVFELNAVVTSKEETNEDLIGKIESLLMERKKMSEHIASLKNTCDDQKSYIAAHVSKVEEMNQSMETSNYEISELLTSVKKANGSLLSTIIEESEDEAGENEEDVCDGGHSDNIISHQLHALQNLGKQVALLIDAFSRTDGLCSAQDKEIYELRERLKSLDSRQQKTETVSDVGGEQVSDSTRGVGLEKRPVDEVLEKTDSSKTESVNAKDEGKVQDLCVNTKVQNLQSELEKMSGELVSVKEEMAEVIKKLTASQKHAEDLEERLKSETETKVAKETQLQDALSELTSVQSQLKSADLTIDQLQSTSCDLMKGQEEVGPLKVQLEKREEQLQNLSSQLAEFIQKNDDQQGKLAEKDEKIMSLLENMQELEEQLTSLGNQRETDVGQLTAELAEKTAALEEAEKSLQAKETHYIKVLATAKRLKQQGEIAKKEAAEAKSELKELQEKMASESSPPDQTAGQIEMASGGDVDSNSSKRLQELTMQVESFSEYCQQLQLQVQTLSEKLHTAEQMANTKQMQLEVLQALSDEKESFAASQNKLLEGFEKKLVDVQEEKEALANVVVGKEELIQTLRDRAEELDRKLKSLETETEKDARIRLLNEQLDESGKTMHSLQEEISRREEKLTESKQNEAKKKEEYEQITEQLKRAEEVSKAKHEISEQLASQIFDLSEQFQAKCVQAEELFSRLKFSEEKFKVLEVELAERESSLNAFKQKLMTSEEEGERLVDEMKNFKELYNSNLEKLTAQQEVLKTKEDELLDVQKQLDHLKGFLQMEDLLGRYKDHLDNLNSVETIPETVVQTSVKSSEPVFVADDKRPLDQTVIEFSDTNFSGMYESLKLEFDLVFSEKERLILENFELKKLLTAVQDKEKESILTQKSYETRIGQLEDNLHVSRTDMASLEESLEDSHEKLCKVEEQNKQLLKEKENLTLQIADLLAVKKGDDSLVVQEREEEKKMDDDQNKVPFVEKIQQEFQGSVYQVRIERDDVQRSASEGPVKESEELEHMKELYEKLTDEHEHLKNKHQIADVKCEKMLIKLKAFKEKNESLLQELSQLKESQKEELESEKQNHQETQNLLLAEQAVVAKERAKIAKMETAFRSKFQEVFNEKNHLSGSCDQLKTKCKELGARLKELLAERQDLQDSIDRLISESQTSLESMRNEHVLEKSSLQNKISSLEVECKNSYADLEDFQKLVAKMKESQESLKSENQNLKDVAHRLKDDMVNKHSVEEKIDRLELEVQGLQEERNSLQDQVDAAREEALTKMKELQGVRKKLADAEGRLILQQEQVTELKELSETLQNSIFSLEADLQASQRHREHAEKEKDRLSEEITVLQKATANTEILKSELSLVEHEMERKEQSVVIFKHEVEVLNEQVQSLTSQCRDLESTRQAITVLKKENVSLTDDVMKLNAENADLRSTREELGVVSERYNNLLQDNTALAKQIEELLTQLQKRSQLEKDLAFAHDQHGHLEREQATFIQRIEDLEEQSQQLTNENTQLKQEMVHVNSSLKQVQFENESLKSQLQVMQSGGDRLSRFQEEYEKLQTQFAQSVEQNNKVQAELNHSTHRLQLRDARCQQLAMQVSQLAEDRSYLNIQMGNLSLALREKEKDASNLASQCQAWHNKHSQLQQKVTELETGRAEALKLSNTQPLTSEIEALKEKIRELEVHQEDMLKQNLEQTSQFTSEREQRLLAETNLIQLQEQIQIMQQKQSAQDYQIQIDDDQEQILDAQLLLSRQSSSYLQRLQRWLMVRKAFIGAPTFVGAGHSVKDERSTSWHSNMFREYLCFSSRQLHRLMRIRPGVRTLVRIYFLFLHVVIAACIFGFL